MSSLLARLREHAAFLGAQQTTEEDAGGVYLKQSELAAVLNLIEAAQAFLSVPRNVERDPDGVYRADFTPQQEARKALAEAVAVFVSGQEEPNEGGAG